MGRKKNKIEKIIIPKEELLRIERSASRQGDIDEGIEPYKTKVHKNSKKYTRKKKYRESYNNDDLN